MGRASRQKAERGAARDDAAPGPGSSRRREWIATSLAFLVGLGAVAFVYRGRGDAASAPPVARPLPRRTPAVQAALDRARKHFEAQELAEAQTELEAAERLEPRDPEVAFVLGDVAYRSLQMAAAERHYRRAVELDPRSSAALANLALVLLELGQAREAVDAATRALALQPDEPRLQALVGQCRLRLGQPKEAAELLERAVEAGLRGAERQATLGRARDLVGQTEAALAAFDEAQRQDPQLPLVHYWRAECLRRIGRAREADRERTVYRQCQDRMDHIVRAEVRVLQNGNDVAALLELARLRVERGIASQAVPLVARAEQLAPQSADVHRVGALVRKAVETTRDVEP